MGPLHGNEGSNKYSSNKRIDTKNSLTTNQAVFFVIILPTLVRIFFEPQIFRLFLPPSSALLRLCREHKVLAAD